MEVKRGFSKILLLLILFLYPLWGISLVRASYPSLSFYPESGIVKSRDDGFTVDVLIDGGEYDLTEARLAFTFDPRQIQIVSAAKNNSLFDQWPEDESSLDNTNGVVMLTGFTQSGSGDLYHTEGDPDILARLEFEIITSSDDDIELNWEFNGDDELFQSVLIADGSPPQVVLTYTPEDATFRFSTLSQTAIGDGYLPFILGGLLLLGAGAVITSKPDASRKKFGTVVVYDD